MVTPRRYTGNPSYPQNKKRPNKAVLWYCTRCSDYEVALAALNVVLPALYAPEATRPTVRPANIVI